MLSAKLPDEPTLNAVAASITVGYAAPVIFTEGGRLDDAIKKVIAIAERDRIPEGAEGGASASKPDEGSAGGSGTGFFVSVEGHVLTNAHVVEGCLAVFVDGAPARVLGASEDFDLAILKTATDPEKAKIAVFAQAAQPSLIQM